MDERPRRQLRSRNGRQRVTRSNAKSERLMDLLSDDHLVTIFSHLPQFPDLLRVREVCRRWSRLSCDMRLWKSLSFKDHEHVTNSRSIEELCHSTPALMTLRHLSLARIHGVCENAVRAIPRAACAATLESVDLTWCSGASDKSVVEFSRCPALRELHLSHCRNVSRRSVRILAVRCPRLEVLDINCISGVRDSLLQVLGMNCPFLRVLNVANAKNITDEGLMFIAKGCERLEVLDLSWCQHITDWAIVKIARAMPQLKEIGLSETKVTDQGVLELVTKCSNLRALHLARCPDITDQGAFNIIKHCRLRLSSLNLASCQNVSDQFVMEVIRKCPNLLYLDVSKLPCRPISTLLQQEKENRSRNLEVYF